MKAKPFTNRMGQRLSALLPGGVPRYVRCYRADNGMDEFTAVYSGRYRKRGDWFQYVGMSANPFHPMGIGQHGESRTQIDVNKAGFAPAIGRKNHLGTRIRFEDLPKDCRKLVLRDYREIWGLP